MKKKIRIKSCKYNHYWYNNSIGNVYEVESGVIGYECLGDRKGYTILVEDAEEVIN